MEGETRIGFTGHQGLDSRSEDLIELALREKVQAAAPITGICSLAEGSDQIFAREVLSTHGSLIVIVPCRGYAQTFVDDRALEEFNTLLSKAQSVIELDFPEPSEQAFWAAGKRVVAEAEQVMAVWDGKPAGGLGGTADVVAFAREEGKPVTVVWPEGAARNS